VAYSWLPGSYLEFCYNFRMLGPIQLNVLATAQLKVPFENTLPQIFSDQIIIHG
jgi:hypothetical protein